MIELRWVILLAVWTLLIGPVIDLTQHAPSAHHESAKTSTTGKRAASSER